MSVMAGIGAASIGVYIGWIVRYFIKRFDKYSAASLTAVASVLAGTALFQALDLVHADRGVDESIWPYYAIGVLFGWLFYTVRDLWKPLVKRPKLRDSIVVYANGCPVRVVVYDESGRQLDPLSVFNADSLERAMLTSHDRSILESEVVQREPADRTSTAAT